MESSILSEQAYSSASILDSLENCSEESIYSPGIIQPNGVLLALRESDLTILQVSDNAKQILNSPAEVTEAIVGQSLDRLFPHPQAKQIAEFLAQDNWDLCNPFELKVRSRVFRGTLIRTDKAVLLELEPQLQTENSGSIQFYQRLQAAILSLRGASNSTDLAQRLARQVKALTGFDRVMIYRFEADDHGVVIAEDKKPQLESFLGLHFPAIDIPAPARKLFLRNWIRQIPDVNHTPATLIPADAFSAESPLDLSDSILRGVSPYHIEYLQNMGVGATLTISLIDDQQLWGLISCHHYSPKQVDYETRKMCEFLGQFASIELVHQQDRELGSYRTQVSAIQDRLQIAFLRDPNFIQQVLTRNATELLHLVHADGVAIAFDERVSLIGQTPPLDDVQKLLVWLSQLKQPEFYLTSCLARPYPPAREFKETASGILAISIVLHQRSYHLVWFRPEQVQTVHWAGNPQDAIAIDELGVMHLCPRKSFELWKETVRETSQPWQLAEVEAARMMRNTLLLAVLEFSQIALEQAAERAAIANRAKSQFLAKMSHELRTPLNAILGFAQLMNRNPNIPIEFQESVGIINRSGEHLLALINDVLEMSRIEAGQLVLAERHFNLHRLLRSLRDMFALKAAQKGLTLLFEEEPGVPLYVCGDEAKLRQILINLISNAIKFTTQGQVGVHMGVDSQTTGQDCTCYSSATAPCRLLQLSILVRDTGCGIDRREWESIFEAFMQTARGRDAEGTGLGLSISRQFARLMGGDITVQSVINQGATFTCRIHLRQPEAIELLELEHDRLIIGLEPNQPTYRILVAEDTQESQQLLLALLESIGFEVVTVANGIDAVTQWQAWQPDLILMDVQMPGMNGHEATQKIRSLEAALQRSATPIIALTAYAFETDRQVSLRAGCNEHISKPFNETVLLEAIARYLGVRYRYSDRSQDALIPPPRNLTYEDLKFMPAEWLMQVREAALDLQDDRLYQLITHIPDRDQWLIEALTSLVDKLQFEAIVTLTQSPEAPA